MAFNVTLFQDNIHPIIENSILQQQYAANTIGGGLLPTVSVSAGATDIYSFMTFDGGQSLFGVVGGQNFS